MNNRGELLLPGVAEAILPTPAAADADRTTDAYARGNPTLSGALLPSPVVTDSESARNSTAGRSNSKHAAHSGDTLLDAMTLLGLADPGTVDPAESDDGQLLPTPAVNQNDGEGVDTWEARRQRIAEKGINGNGAGTPLPIAVQLLDNGPVDATADGEPVRWGRYRAAIVRAQDVAGRIAPSPTLADGKGGKRRLAARFVEWMMLLPVGWVTDVPGLTRRDVLKLLGNGVVPAQAAAASLVLLQRVAVRLSESRPDRGRP